MENFNYEKSLARLEEISTTLEKGEVSLDESIKLYAEGAKLIEKCSRVLNEAQIKITKISADIGENNE